MISVNQTAEGVLKELRTNGFKGIKFPDIRTTNEDNWSEKYAMFGTAYYNTSPFDDVEFFDHAEFKYQFEVYLKEKFPDCTIRLYWPTQEIEIERKDYGSK